MAPTLRHFFSMRGYMSQHNSVDLKAIQGGASRIIVPIASGFVQGAGLDAKLLPGGGDWILLNESTGIAHLDVRTQATTTDGHSLYIYYSGRLRHDEKAKKVLDWKSDARTTEYGDHYWFSSPIIETSDPKFKWVEDVVWIGQGRFVVDETGSAVEYQIYQVDN